MKRTRMDASAVSRIFQTAALLAIAALIAAPAQAASFDCAAAKSKAEKFICEHEAISKLDDELAKTYRAVSDKLDAAGKQKLVAEQRHWLTHTRAPCRNEVCFKLAYWSRQSELATYFEPKSPLYAKESDKAEAVKNVLATAKLYYSSGSNRAQCEQQLADLKQMKGIRFVDPVAQAMSYEDPVLDPWKKNCAGKPPFHFHYGCDPRFGINDLKSVTEGMCDAGIGLPPIKVFELLPLKASDQIHIILYTDDSFGHVNHPEKQHLTGLGYANGFNEIRVEQCAVPKKGTWAATRGGMRDGPNYNSVIEYQQRYFIMVLEKEYDSYWLNVVATDRNENCRWTPVEK